MARPRQSNSWAVCDPVGRFLEHARLQFSGDVEHPIRAAAYSHSNVMPEAAGGVGRIFRLLRFIFFDLVRPGDEVIADGYRCECDGNGCESAY